MNSYYVNFQDGTRVTVSANGRNEAASMAVDETGRDYGSIISVFNVAAFGGCVYCGEPTDRMVCSDKCQREHYGM